MLHFLDTEFNKLTNKLISLAMVREDGQFIYFIMKDQLHGNLRHRMYNIQNGILKKSQDEVENYTFLLKHVYANLYISNIEKSIVTQGRAKKLLVDYFQDDPDPVIVSDFPTDFEYFCPLIRDDQGNILPKIDSLRMHIELNVRCWPNDLHELYRDHLPVQHNALWDACALHRVSVPKQAYSIPHFLL